MFLVWLACGTPDAAPPPVPSEPPGEVAMSRVTGTAGNAKLGAVVEGAEGPVYLLDRHEWPAELVGKTVTVEGVIETTDAFAATTGPNGEISQGTTGHDRVMRISKLITP
jgi:hypothetical protein